MLTSRSDARDLVIFVLTTDKLIAVPLAAHAHVRDNKCRGGGGGAAPPTAHTMVDNYKCPRLAVHAFVFDSAGISPTDN